MIFVSKRRYNALSDYSDCQQVTIDGLRKEIRRMEAEITLLWTHINKDSNKPQKRAKDGKWCK